jgi:hypothetical protein
VTRASDQSLFAAAVRSGFLAAVFAVAAIWAAPAWASDDEDPGDAPAVTLQGGQLTSNTVFTGNQDLSQVQLGLRVRYLESEPAWEVREELGLLRCSAGWFFDAEFSAIWKIHVGRGLLQPMMPVGIPVALIGAPYNFTGFDITWGAGLEARFPLGPVWLEARGQAAFNFLSYIAKLNGDPYDASNGGVSARDAMLLYRVVAALWFPAWGTPVRLEARRDSFNTWWMTAVGLGAAF